MMVVGTCMYKLSAHRLSLNITMDFSRYFSCMMLLGTWSIDCVAHIPALYTTVILKITSVTLVARRSRDIHSLPAFLVLCEALILFLQIYICDTYRVIFWYENYGHTAILSVRQCCKTKYLPGAIFNYDVRGNINITLQASYINIWLPWEHVCTGRVGPC